MELTLNSAVMGVELSGIRRFTFLVRATPGASGEISIDFAADGLPPATARISAVK